jgi:lipoate-protein ligase A
MHSMKRDLIRMERDPKGVFQPADDGCQPWWVLWTGFADGAWNMAVDEWLMSTAVARPPTLRLYGWRFPTVSLGRNERWRRAVDPLRLARAQVRLVRRPTGGRAVLHHRELTYSVTAPLARYPELGQRLEDTLDRIARALLAGLSRLGVTASVRRRTEPLGRQEGACFASTTRFELVSGGTKRVGSAQYRTAAAFLQHGSIPAYPTLRELDRLAARNENAVPGKLEPEPWATLAPDHVGQSMAFGFAHSFGAGVRWQGLKILDARGVANLQRSRYAHAEWTFRR